MRPGQPWDPPNPLHSEPRTGYTIKSWLDRVCSIKKNRPSVMHISSPGVQVMVHWVQRKGVFHNPYYFLGVTRRIRNPKRFTGMSTWIRTSATAGEGASTGATFRNAWRRIHFANGQSPCRLSENIVLWISEGRRCWRLNSTTVSGWNSAATGKILLL